MDVNEKISNRSLVNLTIISGMFLWSFSAGMVNLSLPTIAQYFDIGSATVSWVIVCHFITLVGLILFFGRLAYYVGHKTIFMWGVFIFVLASFFCGISSKIEHILILRAIQGIGSAMLLSVTPAILSKISSSKSRGKAFGYISLATTLGLSIGYLVGGTILEYASWNWIFIVNVPIGIIVLLMAQKFMAKETIVPPKDKLDKKGAIILFLFFLALILAIEPMRTVEFPILTISVGLAISIILGLIFIFWELRHPYPLIDLKLFLNPYLTLTVLIAFLTTLVLTGTIFLVPFYLDLVMSYSTELAGLIIFMATLVILVGGPLSGRLSDRFGAKKINILGVFILLIALVLFTFFNQTVGLTFILIVLALRALSDGVSNPANSKLVISYSPPGMEYTVSSLLNAARYLGVVTGVVVFEAVFNKTISQYGQALTAHGSIEKTLPVGALVNGFQTAFYIGVVLTVVILILTFLGSAAPDEN